MTRSSDTHSNLKSNLISEHSLKFPEIKDLANAKAVFWINNHQLPFADAHSALDFSESDEHDAAARLKRFGPYIALTFPETRPTNGIIESELVTAPAMKKALETFYDMDLAGRLLIKLDSHLPISGSIKARGGIYEVLKYAESLAIKAGLLNTNDDYSVLSTEKFTEFFGDYALVVGSTGNLGMSIGIMGASLGLKVTVHMSSDARQWKKDLLRSKGVTVQEYEDDYSFAVAQGRAEAEKDPNCHFVDDESSADLFLGYSVAAKRLKKQLAELEINVDNEHPLFVYLPCGVGGGPGGLSFGLKLAFGDNVHCIFAEPTHAPAVILGLGTGLHEDISAKDIGLDGLTAADGLAVSRPSGLVCKNMEPLLDGVYTVEDKELYQLLRLVADTEKLQLEPSALAGFPGISIVNKANDYLEAKGLLDKMENATHIAWATGGSMVPDSVWQDYYDLGDARNC